MDNASELRNRLALEVIGEPTQTMREYLSHFGGEANEFIDGLTHTAEVWERYGSVSPTKADHKEALAFSGAYFLNAINAALISTRLLLSGYLIASGNQARQAVESLAFGVLLPFPNTHAYRDWKAGHSIEHKSLERLAKNAVTCGLNQRAAQELAKQARWFDQCSHPSRLAVATLFDSSSEHGWQVGSSFVLERLPYYKKEIHNRVSLARVVGRTIVGTATTLKKQGLIDPTSWR